MIARRHLVPVLGLVAVAAAAFASLSISRPAGESGEKIISEVMSPYCPGLTLAECPHSQSEVLRDEILDKQEQGWDEQRIESWLVANYGEGILGRPTVLAWAAPAAGIIVSAVALWFWLRSSGSPGRDSHEQVDPETRQRIAEELEAFTSRRSE